MREAAGETGAGGLADVIHAELCGSDDGWECRRYARGAGDSHWEFYQVKARAVYSRLEPEIGGANVELAVRIVLEELL